jgi:FAD/FMN-containing dehydrogenase
MAPSGFAGVFRTDADARAVYSEAAGIARILPRAVAVPVDTDDLVKLVRWAADERVPLIPRGSGSSMAGGAIGDGVVVDLSRWRELGCVDADARMVSAQPGVLRDEMDAAARAVGLRLPVDPSSGAFCTVGGMAATNAAGAHTLAFGSTRRWVRAIDCVFADGSRARVRRGETPDAGDSPTLARVAGVLDERFRDDLRRAPAAHAVAKESSGFSLDAFALSGDLVDLLVGSEGTLAFFTRVELALAPLPGATSSVLGAFDNLESAVMAATAARSAGAVACELLDRTFLEVAARGGGARMVPDDTESALLAEVEGGDGELAAAAARALEEMFRRAGATMTRVAIDPRMETELWELRHAASPILSRLYASLESMQFIEDGAVPADRLPEYVRGVRGILARHDTPGVIFGHAGDAHVHVNPLVDVHRRDWRERVAAILDDVVTLTASLNGTLSGEHGDGRLRTPLLHRVWSAAAVERFAMVKRAFDPAGILNPGVKVPTPGELPLADIQYDPELAPLPPAARDALARVERERAYARSRQGLLADNPRRR